MEEKYGKESLHSLQEWEGIQVKDSDHSNYQKFTLRYLSKDLIPVRLKSTINTKKAKLIIHKAERQLCQDRIKGINSIFWDNTVRLDRCRSRLAS